MKEGQRETRARGRELERITERISLRGTNLEISSSFDFNTTSRIMQSGRKNRSVSVNRNGRRARGTVRENQRISMRIDLEFR